MCQVLRPRSAATACAVTTHAGRRAHRCDGQAHCSPAVLEHVLDHVLDVGRRQVRRPAPPVAARRDAAATWARNKVGMGCVSAKCKSCTCAHVCSLHVRRCSQLTLRRRSRAAPACPASGTAGSQRSSAAAARAQACKPPTQRKSRSRARNTHEHEQEQCAVGCGCVRRGIGRRQSWRHPGSGARGQRGALPAGMPRHTMSN